MDINPSDSVADDLDERYMRLAACDPIVRSFEEGMRHGLFRDRIHMYVALIVYLAEENARHLQARVEACQEKMTISSNLRDMIADNARIQSQQ